MILIYIIIFISVLLDQIFKMIVSYNMDLNASITVIKNFFNITYVHNTGAAFSILTGSRILLIVVGLVTLNIIYFMFINKKELKLFEKFTYGFLMGGIIGNLLDRIIYGYVIDYLDFKIINYDFPIFNLADMLIVISVFLIIISMLRGKNGNNCK